MVKRSTHLAFASRFAVRSAVSAAAFVALACAGTPGEKAADSAAATTASRGEGASAPSIVERDWALVTLGDSAAPLGSGGKPATIRFDSAATRAGGFAGCNRYSAQYFMSGDSLHFGPAISTKMACAEGDALERAYLAIMPSVTGYQASDSTLTLTGSGGALAKFRAQ
jgi:putative lipoprotein